MSIYLVDIDGTIADNKHREWVLKENRPRPNWDLFFNLAAQDTPVPGMSDLLCDLYYGNDRAQLLYVTGRPERLRPLTQAWLEANLFPVPRMDGGHCRMFMRADGDHRPDEIIKSEMLDHIIEHYGKPLVAFDDRNKVVAMWRARGIVCAQVAEGDF